MRRIAIMVSFFFSGILGLSQAALADDFALTTSSFLDTGILPTLYTCADQDVSPDLAWSNPPDKATSFMVVFSDTDAPNGTFYHWVVYNLPKATTKLDQGIKQYPAGAMIAKNGFGKTQYNGPCPPKGSIHTYVITVYALDTTLSSPAGTDAKSVMNELDSKKTHILKQAQLTAVFPRWANNNQLSKTQ